MDKLMLDFFFVAALLILPSGLEGRQSAPDDYLPGFSASVSLEEEERELGWVSGVATFSVRNQLTTVVDNLNIRFYRMRGVLGRGVLQLGSLEAQTIGVVSARFQLPEATYDAIEPLWIEVEYSDSDGAWREVIVIERAPTDEEEGEEEEGE